MNTDGYLEKMLKKLSCQGQSIVEYTMIVVMLMMALFFIGTGLKRGVQSLVKVTADQVGNQQNSDQDFSSTEGYMVASNTQLYSNMSNEVKETGYIDNTTNNAVYLMNRAYNELTNSQTNSLTQGGFAPNN